MTTLHRLRELAPSELASQLTRGVWSRLAKQYACPQRAYHNLSHILAFAEWFAEWCERWQQPNEVFAALLYHDAVYDPLAHDNEARSAALALESLAHTSLDASVVVSLIAGTASSAQPKGSGHGDLGLFVDCDRAVLGAPLEVYQRYAAGIAAEYSMLPPANYRDGRSGFLKRVLRSRTPFATAAMQQRLGRQAVANLEWELGNLGYGIEGVGLG